MKRLFLYAGLAITGLAIAAWARWSEHQDAQRDLAAYGSISQTIENTTYSPSHVRVDSELQMDLALFPTGFAPHPYARCSDTSVFNLPELIQRIGRLESGVGCKIQLDASIAVSDSVTLDLADGSQIALARIPALGLWLIAPGPTTRTGNPAAKGILARLDQLVATGYPDSRDFAAAISAAQGTAGRSDTLVVLTGPVANARAHPSLPWYVPLAGSQQQMLARMRPSTPVPPKNRIEGRAVRIPFSDSPMASIMTVPDDDSSVVILEPRSRQSLQKRNSRLRFLQYALAAALLLWSFAGIRGWARGRRREVEQIVLLPDAGQAPEDGQDDADAPPAPLPTVSSDKVPDERAVELFKRTTTLKDWIFATDDDRKQFIRKYMVKWSGGMDLDHGDRLRVFLNVAVDQIVRHHGVGDTEKLASDSAQVDALKPVLRTALDHILVEDPVPLDEHATLARGRYYFTHSPAVAQLATCRQLIWFARIAVKKMEISRPGQKADPEES